MPPVKKPKAKPIKKVEVEEATPVVSGQLKKKLKKQQKRRAKLNRGVVFVKHLPHGFFEDQLQNYFEQFGTVTRLRLARSRTTGGTKGYAFVEFEYPEVAEVAAETMDNYLMFNKVVKAAYIPPDKQMFNFFRSSVRRVRNKANKPIYVSKKTAAIVRRVKKFNDWTEDAYQKRTLSKLKKIENLNKKYAHLGIDFNNILVGSKKLDEQQSKDASVEASVDQKTKAGKRKNLTAEQQSKKTKKEPKLEDLLGETINEDSEDEDYVDNEEETSKSSSKDLQESFQLKDLLGDTLNDDSEDEWDGDDDENETDDDEDEDEQSANSESDSNEDDYNIEFKKPLKGGKLAGKEKNSKVDRLEQLIQHKKHAGGIQKASKVLSKKNKINQPKNPMQAKMVKQLAKPMKSLKKKKGGKN